MKSNAMGFIAALIMIGFITMMTIAFRNIATEEHEANRKIQTCEQRGGEVRLGTSTFYCTK